MVIVCAKLRGEQVRFPVANECAIGSKAEEIFTLRVIARERVDMIATAGPSREIPRGKLKK